MCIESNYHMDELHGKQLMWYKNGNLEEESNYYHGFLHGKFIRWNKTGKIIE